MDDDFKYDEFSETWYWGTQFCGCGIQWDSDAHEGSGGWVTNAVFGEIIVGGGPYLKFEEAARDTRETLRRLSHE